MTSINIASQTYRAPKIAGEIIEYLICIYFPCKEYTVQLN